MHHKRGKPRAFKSNKEWGTPKEYQKGYFSSEPEIWLFANQFYELHHASDVKPKKKRKDYCIPLKGKHNFEWYETHDNSYLGLGTWLYFHCSGCGKKKIYDHDISTLTTS